MDAPSDPPGEREAYPSSVERTEKDIQPADPEKQPYPVEAVRKVFERTEIAPYRDPIGLG